MTTEIQTTKEPGQRNWASALSRIPELYRPSVSEGVRMRIAGDDAQAIKQSHPDLSDLEQRMLGGGRGLSLITYAAFIPFHMLQGECQEREACEMLRSGLITELMSNLNARLELASRVLLIGDDPSAASVGRAFKLCEESGVVGCLIAGPGNLMEAAVRTWAINSNWPNAYLRTPDGSNGDVWHAQAGDAIDEAVNNLFEFHKPTMVALLEPVRLPATQASIEQASRRKIPMITIDALRLNSGPR